ncbi:hypothetical protein VTI74DRAFT_2372 [Chaetomium olivicolor]
MRADEVFPDNRQRRRSVAVGIMSIANTPPFSPGGVSQLVKPRPKDGGRPAIQPSQVLNWGLSSTATRREARRQAVVTTSAESDKVPITTASMARSCGTCRVLGNVKRRVLSCHCATLSSSRGTGCSGWLLHSMTTHSTINCCVCKRGDDHPPWIAGWQHVVSRIGYLQRTFHGS